MNYIKLVAFFAAVAANWGHDLAYQVHVLLTLEVAAGLFYSGAAQHRRTGQSH